MTRRVGFDNERYLAEQTAAIVERVNRFAGKLYLEFGGKLLFDYHAARVLPGFDPNVKMRLLQKLRTGQRSCCASTPATSSEGRSGPISASPTTADALKLIDDLRAWQIELCGGGHHPL